MHKKNIPINAIKIGILLFTVLIGTFTIVMCWKNINTRSANNKIKLNTIEESIKTKIEIYDFALEDLKQKIEENKGISNEDIFKLIKSGERFLKKYNDHRSTMELLWKSNDSKNHHINQFGIKKVYHKNNEQQEEVNSIGVVKKIRDDKVYEASIKCTERNGKSLGSFYIIEDLANIASMPAYSDGKSEDNFVLSTIKREGDAVESISRFIVGGKCVMVAGKCLYVTLNEQTFFSAIIYDIYPNIIFSILSLASFIFLTEFLNKKNTKQLLKVEKSCDFLRKKERFLAKFLITLENRGECFFINKKNTQGKKGYRFDKVNDLYCFSSIALQDSVDYFSENIKEKNLYVKCFFNKEVEGICVDMLLLQRCVLSLISQSIYNLRKNGEIEIKIYLNKKNELVLSYKDDSYPMEIEDEKIEKIESLEFYVKKDKLSDVVFKGGGDFQESIVSCQGREVQVLLPILNQNYKANHSNIINIFSKNND